MDDHLSPHRPKDAYDRLRYTPVALILCVFAYLTLTQHVMPKVRDLIDPFPIKQEHAAIDRFDRIVAGLVEPEDVDVPWSIDDGPVPPEPRPFRDTTPLRADCVVPISYVTWLTGDYVEEFSAYDMSRETGRFRGLRTYQLDCRRTTGMVVTSQGQYIHEANVLIVACPVWHSSQTYGPGFMGATIGAHTVVRFAVDLLIYDLKKDAVIGYAKILPTTPLPASISISDDTPATIYQTHQAMTDLSDWIAQHQAP